MLFSSWNVNSINVRLPQVLDWLAKQASPIAIALQETKVEDRAFPKAHIEAAGWQMVFSGQKAYNGVAIISSNSLSDIQINIPEFNDPQKRVLAATVGDIRFISIYAPNGQSLDSDKYGYKLAWYAALTQWLKNELHRYPRLILAGDYNIAPEDRDVHATQSWEGKVLVSPPERAAFQSLLALGLHDAFRVLQQDERIFSWWDYRYSSVKRNAGLRIDHLLLSTALLPTLLASGIAVEQRRNTCPSDHAPVWARLHL